MTAHIEAKKEEIAQTVIMPGDPKRARFICEKYLDDYKLVNEVRGMLAYTGFYKGKRVTIMASGMGMPSIGIYSYELYKFYDVENIIRVGSAGSYKKDLKLYDVLLVTESYSDSSYAKVQSNVDDTIMYPSTKLCDEIRNASKKIDLNLKEGRIYSSDVFYLENHDIKKMSEEYGFLATEMESFALFHTANRLGKNAACLLTISNHFITGEETTSEEREKSFTKMIELALETIK